MDDAAHRPVGEHSDCVRANNCVPEPIDTSPVRENRQAEAPPDEKPSGFHPSLRRIALTIAAHHRMSNGSKVLDVDLDHCLTWIRSIRGLLVTGREGSLRVEHLDSSEPAIDSPRLAIHQFQGALDGPDLFLDLRH
jgi:hypothetical protein